MHRLIRRTASALLLLTSVAASMAAAFPAQAVTNPIYFDADATILVSGPSYYLTLLAGSHMDSPADQIAVRSTSITVTMTGTGHVTFRWPGPTPGRFPNDGGLAECNYVGGNNDFVIDGPAAVTITPSNATACAAPSTGGGGGGGGNTSVTITPSVSVSSPNGGEVLEGGTSASIFWTAGGSQVTGTRLSYSTDNGATWTVFNASASGGYAPLLLPMTATTQAKIRAEAMLVGGAVGATDTSDGTFTITVPPGVTGDYDTGDVTAATPTINDDEGLQNVPLPQNPACVAGSLVKMVSDGDLSTTADSSVYYCGKDGKRYVFPSFWIYSTWYPDFSSVKEIGPAVMSTIRLGGNVTYRPGVRMVKIQSDPKVYAVAAHGTLRWVTSEEVALRLYGPNWNKAIDDVSDAFFADYVIGEPIY